MIEVEAIRERLRAEPFRPFVVETDDGQRVPVLRREWTLLTGGGWFFVATDRQIGQGEDELFQLDVRSIARVIDDAKVAASVYASV